MRHLWLVFFLAGSLHAVTPGIFTRADIANAPGLLSFYDQVKSQPGEATVDVVERLSFSFGLNFDFDDTKALEVGFTLGPRLRLNYASPLGTRYQEESSSVTYFAAPKLRLPWRYGLALFVGLPLGFTQVSGEGRLEDGNGGASNYTQGNGYSIGSTLGLEYTPWRWITFSMDATYTWSLTPGLQRKSDGPLPAFDLRQGSLDLSGLSFRQYFRFNPQVQPYEPFPGPPVSAGLDERQVLYQRFSVQKHWWRGLTVGGKKPGAFPDQQSAFRRYFEASGDQEAAREVYQAQVYYWTGLGVAAAAILGGLAQPRDAHNTFSAATYNCIGAGLGANLVFHLWGKKWHFEPAIEHFNRHLREQLGLN
jgi:hypothetical protein